MEDTNDKLVTPKTFNLAKEKGYVHSVLSLYIMPSQSYLQKWLREVHKINIFISSKTIENKTIFIPHGRTIPDTIKNNLIVDIIQYCTNNTYEEALEIALFEALKLI